MNSKHIQRILYLYLQQTFKQIEDNHKVKISDIIGYITTRPFNMKGQEFQELLAYPLQKEIDGNASNIGDLCIKIESPADKKKTDLFLNIDDERYNFSIKNYTTTRFQISTMANQLAKYESRFSDYSINSVVSLTEEQQGEIISDIQEDIANDITIFALTHKKSSQIDIYLLSLKEDFLNNVNEMKAEYSNREKTPHRRIRFFYEGMEKYLFSLDLGKNALNRGIWGENWKDLINQDSIRQKFFHSLLVVPLKDLTPFLNIDQNAKNEAIMKLIEESLYGPNTLNSEP